MPPPRTYTRTDFAAFRAFAQRIDAGVIARRYYDPDTTLHASSPETLARYLRTMLDDLVQLALRNGSAALASHLKASIKQLGSAKLTAVTLRMVERASTVAAAAPSLDHHVGLWFRPLVTKRLTRCAIRTAFAWLTTVRYLAQWRGGALSPRYRRCLAPTAHVRRGILRAGRHTGCQSV